MRILGILFLVLLVVGIVGWYRGWFAVETHAGSRATVTIDEAKIDEDTRRAQERLAELSAQAVEKVKSLARGTSADERTVEGTIATVDAGTRAVTVRAGEQSVDVHVPTSVVIRRDGRDVTFDQIVVARRANLVFHVRGDTWRLVRVELLS